MYTFAYLIYIYIELILNTRHSGESRGKLQTRPSLLSRTSRSADDKCTRRGAFQVGVPAGLIGKVAGTLLVAAQTDLAASMAF